MMIIHDKKIDLQLLKKITEKPEIFEKGTDRFWDDEYISEQMLKLAIDLSIIKTQQCSYA